MADVMNTFLLMEDVSLELINPLAIKAESIAKEEITLLKCWKSGNSTLQ